MKFWLALVMICSSTAFAQLSDIEKEGSDFKIFGRNWYPSAFSLASVEMDKTDDGGRLSTYNYLTFSSHMTGDYRMALRVPFTYGTAGTDRFNGSKPNEQELELQDTILEVKNNEFLYMPWDIGVYFAGRLYLPVSKHSKESGQIARYRNEMIFSKNFTQRWSVDYDQKLNFYMQSRKSYRTQFEDEYGFPVDAVSLTKRFEFQHWTTLWARIGAEGGLGWSVKYEDTYWNKSKTENKSRSAEHLMLTGPCARIPFSDYVNFILSYEDKVDVEQNYKELGRFMSKNTQVVLNSFISF